MVNVTSILRLAFVLDPRLFWAEDLTKHTIEMVNDRLDGWHDELLPVDTSVQYEFHFSDFADFDVYLDIPTAWKDTPPDVLIDARSSSSSMELAYGSDLLDISQISLTSSSAKLSNKERFPLFSRLVAPDDRTGQAGALVALLDKFGWERVSIIATNTLDSVDFAESFAKLWTCDSKKKVAFSGLVGVHNSSTVDEPSVRQVLDSQSKANSRIIILIGDEMHSFDILRIAHEQRTPESPSDDIWIGSCASTGRHPTNVNTSGLGGRYIGLKPYQGPQESPARQEYLTRLKQRVDAVSGYPVYNYLTDYVAGNLVDSIVAATKALVQIGPSQRRNGTIVTSTLRNLSFEGVTGRVAFNQSTGDRADPAFAVYHMRHGENGQIMSWMEVGIIELSQDQLWKANISRNEIWCAGQDNCNVGDSYNAQFNWKAMVLTLILGLLFAAVLVRYCRSRQKKSIRSKTTEGLGHPFKELFERPENWTKWQGLVEVTTDDPEHLAVLQRLHADMPDANISSLWRVQNDSQWANYCTHKDRWDVIGTPHNEEWVWCGTHEVNPDFIYADRQGGCVMELARNGWWGRAMYFSPQNNYMHDYAYKPFGLTWVGSDRPMGQEDEQELFLGKLLVGHDVLLPPGNYELPPRMHGEDGLRYNTVSGFSQGGTKIYAVFENGRFYPEYLVRYYHSARWDAERTSHLEPLATSTENAPPAPNGTNRTPDLGGFGDHTSPGLGVGLNSTEILSHNEGFEHAIVFLKSNPFILRNAARDRVEPVAGLSDNREAAQLYACFFEAGRDIRLVFDTASSTRFEAATSLRYSCLHFSGHRLSDRFPFEDDGQVCYYLGIERLQESVRQIYGAAFRLVFVNVGNSVSVGRAFVNAGVTHVVCCEKRSGTDFAAEAAFANNFYVALLRGMSVQDCFIRGCESVLGLPGFDHEIDVMRKFRLLPEGGDHSALIFANVMPCAWPGEASERCIRNVIREQPLPLPQASLDGRHMDLYTVLRLVVYRKGLTTVVGEVGSYRTSVVRTICQYINDRKTTFVELKRIYYIDATRGCYAYLVRRLFEGIARNPPGLNGARRDENDQIIQISSATDFKHMADALFAVLRDANALVVICRLEVLNDLDDQPFRTFLGRLAKVSTVLVSSRASLAVPIGRDFGRETVHRLYRPNEISGT